MLNSNLQDTKASILEEAASYDYQMPILMDETQVNIAFEVIKDLKSL